MRSCITASMSSTFEVAMHDVAEDSHFGQEVRRRRRQLGLTQAEVAELAGVAVRTVHAVEAGKSTARLDALVAVLRALGLRLRLERGSVPEGGSGVVR